MILTCIWFFSSCLRRKIGFERGWWGGGDVRDSYQGPVVQSIVSLTSSLRVISLTVLAD